MWKWDKIRRWLELVEHLLTLKDLIEFALALGLGTVITNLIAPRISTRWWLAIWLLSSAFLLWFISWIAPKLKRRGIKPEAWCENAKKQDISKMRYRLVDVKWEAHRSAVDISDPYIDFTVTFVNASVFNLTSPEVEGKAKFQKNAVHYSLELTKHFPVPRGEKVWMELRQRLTSSMATKMQELINARRDGQAPVSLDFSEIKITFDAEFLGRSNPQKFMWLGPERVPVTNPD